MGLTQTSIAWLDFVAFHGAESFHEPNIQDTLTIIAKNVQSKNDAYTMGIAMGTAGYTTDVNPFAGGTLAVHFDMGVLDGEDRVNELLESITVENQKAFKRAFWPKLREQVYHRARYAVTAFLMAAATLTWSMPLRAEDHSYLAALDQRGQSGYSLSDRISLSKLIREWSAQCTVVTSCSDGQVQREGYPMRFDPSQGEAKTKLAAQ